MYLNPLDFISNSPYCLPYNLCDVGLKNLELDQPIIPLLIFFSILITCLLDIVLIMWGEILSRSLVGLNGLKWGISLYWNDENFLMLSNVTKNVMRIWCYATVEKPVAGSLFLWCLNVHGKRFSLKARIQKFSKLIEISCSQVMKSKLTTIP